MKKYILLTVMVLLTIWSCNKQVTYNDAIADVFIRSLKENNVNAYRAVFSVSSYSKMSSVTVDVPNGSSISLSDETGDGITFSKDTSLTGESYSHVPPPSGIYTFHVNYSDGSQKVYTNTLSSDYLLPPVIDSLYRKTDGISLRLKWKPVEGADTYQLRISSGHNEIMPWVQYTNATQLYFQQYISALSPWLPGTITFELRGVKHETDRNYVQSMSYTSVDIDL
jgi:hypothetical protein